MSQRAPHRQGPGILEGAAVMLAVAVASLAMARAYPGLGSCAAPPVLASHEAAPAQRVPSADAADMLLHD